MAMSVTDSLSKCLESKYDMHLYKFFSPSCNVDINFFFFSSNFKNVPCLEKESNVLEEIKVKETYISG